MVPLLVAPNTPDMLPYQPQPVTRNLGMERPIFKPVGTPVTELDTPALVVDLDVLEQNLHTAHTFFQQRAAKLQPLVSTHGCPALAHKQLAAGNTVGGIAVITLGQAEVFVAHGFDDILVANAMVTPAKMVRLCALARQATITVSVDHPTHVQRLADAATAHRVTLRVVVDIDTGANRGGVAPGQPALALAQAAQQASQLDFVGVTTTTAPLQGDDPADRAAAARQHLEPVIETHGLLQHAGFDVRVVSVGGALPYEQAAAVEGVTDIRAGVYALMDAGHTPGSALRPAARVLTTVTSCPESGTAITDAGQKAVGTDRGLPAVSDIPGVVATGLSAEHCCLSLEGHAETQMSQGEKLWLTPWDIGTCVNLYDHLYAARQGQVEAVWPVAARGQYR